MLSPHFLGGESAHRGLLGSGKGNRARRTAFAAWAVAFCVLNITLQMVGLAISLFLLPLVYLGTAQRGRRTLWGLWLEQRAWKARQKAGMTVFKPIWRLPEGAAMTAPEINAYRDWPEGCEGMHWLLSGPGEPGIAWHLPQDQEEYLSVTWRIRGSIAGIESDDFVNRASQAFGSFVAGTARPTVLVDGIQMVTEVTRIDMTPHLVWVMDNIASNAPRELILSQGQLIDRIEESGLTMEHYIVVRWPVDEAFKERAARRGPAHAGWLTLMEDEIRRVDRSLRRARLGDVRVQTATQVCAALRHMQLLSWSSTDLQGIEPAEIGFEYDESSRTHVTTKDLGPDGVEEEWLHRTAEIPVRGLEAATYDALWLMPILSGLPEQVNRRVSTQVRTTASGVARRLARADLTADLAELREQARKGHIEDESVSAGHSAARQRHSDLRPGTGVQGAGWAIHITISARNLDQLRMARDIIEAGCSDAGVTKLDWLDSHHGAAQSWTWPIGRGMAAIDKPAVMRVLDAINEQAEGDEL